MVLRFILSAEFCCCTCALAHAFACWCGCGCVGVFMCVGVCVFCNHVYYCPCVCMYLCLLPCVFVVSGAACTEASQHAGLVQFRHLIFIGWGACGAGLTFLRSRWQASHRHMTDGAMARNLYISQFGMLTLFDRAGTRCSLESEALVDPSKLVQYFAFNICVSQRAVVTLV